ncbi:MAG: peptidylprolyl isomerase [Saprospiraceae bacterium]|nr:peptidylprolyl isomerase [Saprospiraceae bacterium]MDW8483629.1 peptidylprolyl isomerase [Saprospiraceae bacterium]
MCVLRKLGLVAWGASVCWSCLAPEQAKDKQSIQLDWTRPEIQHLYSLRDEGRTDSLIAYLSHPEATLRYLAAIAFASVRDSTAVEPLVPLLRDPIEEIRIAAAFALGQIGSPRAEQPLIEAFRRDDSLSQHQRFNAAVLEAVGKCGGIQSLRHIATVSTYEPTDTVLLEGQCRALYQYALRGMTHPEGTTAMIQYVANERLPASVRLIAAHYLARSPEVVPDSLQAIELAAAFVRSTAPHIRMALAKALGKSRTRPAFGILSKAIRNEQDWRVRCNLINALALFEPDTVFALVFPLVQDPNPHVSRTAAEFFVTHGNAKHADDYWRIARENLDLPWPTRIALYRASYKWLSSGHERKEYLNYRLRDLFLKSPNPYERAACLKALSEVGWQFKWIHDKGFADTIPVVRSSAVEALSTIARRPDFFRHFGDNARLVRRNLLEYFLEAIRSGDVGMMAAAAEGLRSPVLQYRDLVDSAQLAEIQTAHKRLKIPRDYETHLALEKTLAYLEGRPDPLYKKPPYNHPIDWAVLNRLNARSRAVIQTELGALAVQLYPAWAPGSVASFVKLAQEGYYDGKTFHRVVPNFVVQGGCPRGDGYGALDFSLRTEIGLLSYDDEGYVGLASAGPDTEGVQFFITHSPAPHLDGRYTIFGKVVQGMDVVHRLQPGHRIQQVTIQ